MKRILMFILVLLFLLLTGCAGLDLSVADTAETLGHGAVSISQAQTMGMKMPEWVRMDPEDIYGSDTGYAVQYSELKLGITDDMDISFRGGLQDHAYNAKMLMKKQLTKKDKLSTAFVMGVGGMKADEKFWEHPVENESVEVDYSVLSAEIQYLITREVLQDSFLTLAGMYSVHNYMEEYMDGTSEQFLVYNAGARMNAKYVMRPYYGIFELGIEAPLSIEGFSGVYPWIALKAGIEINTK